MRIPFPLKGVDKGRTVSDQPLLTSPDMKNLRPYDTLDNRARGGQRPGLNKMAEYEQRISGSSQPIVAMCTVTIGN
jgi:hypothetical protein